MVRAALFERADCLFAQLFLRLAGLRSRGRNLAWAVRAGRTPSMGILCSPRRSLLYDHTSLPSLGVATWPGLCTGPPAPGADLDLWLGDPQGRWVGDTLVVETTN